ncbi:uncharacterized protein LOC114475878 isoform X4 [Gouania willdenowi]|uniref:uncharacterized protein LOC114475878 isoform X4 n=1 Tax=Gouania willdenowi TaxID=441366 RepID=UPI00105490D7|nr:uncharacterized protein LOC114475878 isoform X4 [Gouania willdenowi]
MSWRPERIAQPSHERCLVPVNMSAVPREPQNSGVALFLSSEKSDAMLYAPSLNEVELVGIFSEQQLAGTQPACTIAAPHSLSLTRLNASRPCGHQRPPRRQTEPLQCQPEQIMETSLQPSVTRAQPDIPAQPLQFEPSNSTTTICEPPAASHSGLTVKTCR